MRHGQSEANWHDPARRLPRKPLLAIAMTLTFGAGAALAQSPGLGKPVSEADIKAWDIAVLPEGTVRPWALAGQPLNQRCNPRMRSGPI
jgi:hypothetical protein